VKRLSALLFLALMLQACGREPVHSAEADNLARARAQWSRQGPSSYRYTLYVDCFCPGLMRTPVRVVVRDGQVVSSDPTRPGLDSFDLKSIRDHDTVLDLFAEVQQAIDREPFQLEVEYHPELGYPVSLWVDLRQEVIDEEYGFRISSFHPME
jgi:hypothetical protein